VSLVIVYFLVILSYAIENYNNSLNLNTHALVVHLKLAYIDIKLRLSWFLCRCLCSFSYIKEAAQETMDKQISNKKE
jgi:hypothetical protein